MYNGSFLKVMLVRLTILLDAIMLVQVCRIHSFGVFQGQMIT